jgi:acyl carrier protein
MDRTQVQQTVLTVLAAVLKQPLDKDFDITRQNTPTWDSLKHIEVMFTLEDELGIEFSEAELSNLDSVAKIVDAVLAKDAA